jgi:hypothetical protein
MTPFSLDLLSLAAYLLSFSGRKCGHRMLKSCLGKEGTSRVASDTEAAMSPCPGESSHYRTQTLDSPQVALQVESIASSHS